MLIRLRFTPTSLSKQTKVSELFYHTISTSLTSLKFQYLGTFNHEFRTYQKGGEKKEKQKRKDLCLKKNPAG